MVVAKFGNKDSTNSLDIQSLLFDDPLDAFKVLKTTNAGMSFNALRTLRSYFGFSQMRIMCVKPPKKFELITTNDEKGRAVVDYLTSNSSSRPEACGSFTKHAWSDFGRNCNIWADQKWGKAGLYGNDRLYGAIAYSTVKQLYVSMGALGRFSCNDNQSDSLLSFTLYVR